MQLGSSGLATRCPSLSYECWPSYEFTFGNDPVIYDSTPASSRYDGPLWRVARFTLQCSPELLQDPVQLQRLYRKPLRLRRHGPSVVPIGSLSGVDHAAGMLDTKLTLVCNTPPKADWPMGRHGIRHRSHSAFRLICSSLG